MTSALDDGSAAARQQVDHARRRAKAEGKRVAVVFGADWCTDSHALDLALEHRLVAPLVAPSYVMVPVDVGNRNRCLELMAEFGMRVERGIPAIAVLEPDGRLVTAQADGEFRNARALPAIEIALFFHRWAPKRS